MRHLIGSPAAMACEPPLDMPEVSEPHLSNQPLGDTVVLVESYIGVAGLPVVQGAWICGEFVEAQEFSARRIGAWSLAIESELQRERDGSISDRAELSKQ